MPRKKEYKAVLHDELSHWKSYTPSDKIHTQSPPPDNPLDIIKNARLQKYSIAYGAIIAVLDARDPYTADHSKRVCAMCLRVCFLLRLPRVQTGNTVLSAMLHDIGKVGVSDAILRKEGRLDTLEFEEIKRHAVIGSNILMKNDGLDIIAVNVRHHHERWDGSGYPDGLCGSEIPLASRIIAICDSIDAMKSDRPYRKGASDSICQEEIKKNAGSMYDPQLASLCLENWIYITEGFYAKAS